MKVDDFGSSSYLKKDDVTPAVRLTITKAEPKNMAKSGQAPELKCVLSFKETDKKLVCNKTNFQLIAMTTSEPDSDNWVGKSIALWFNPAIEFGGDIVGGIRVLTEQPQVPAMPSAPSSSDDEIPF
jgi:hypothetical protein